MSNDATQFFAKFIEKELGIIYSEFNHFQLNNRLEEIATLRGLKTIDELYNQAKQSLSGDLKQLVLDIATNNETSFFRDTRLFQGVKSQLIPELFANKPAVRIWSAACSTGQEPYSLSMLIQEYQDQAKKPVHYSITATDISSRVLARANAAKYSQLDVQRGLPAPLLIKYFEKDKEDYWTVRESVRKHVRFEQLNLLDSFTKMGQFDVIFCRNVLIYQDVANKIKIINKLASCLSPNAYLILGAGESMIGLSDHFDSVKIGEAIVYQVKVNSLKLAV